MRGTGVQQGCLYACADGGQQVSGLQGSSYFWLLIRIEPLPKTDLRDNMDIFAMGCDDQGKIFDCFELGSRITRRIGTVSVDYITTPYGGIEQ